MREAVIVDAVRTPLGRGKDTGRLHGWHAVELGAVPLRAVVERTGIDPALIDDVVFGCVMQTGEQAVNVGRNSALTAGYPETVPATTVDRQCGSSQQAAHFAAQGVIAGAYDVVVAGGVESMSRVPITSARMGADPHGPGLAVVDDRHGVALARRRERGDAALDGDEHGHGLGLARADGDSGGFLPLVDAAPAAEAAEGMEQPAPGYTIAIRVGADGKLSVGVERESAEDVAEEYAGFEQMPDISFPGAF